MPGNRLIRGSRWLSNRDRGPVGGGRLLRAHARRSRRDLHTGGGRRTVPRLNVLQHGQRDVFRSAGAVSARAGQRMPATVRDTRVTAACTRAVWRIFVYLSALVS